MATRLRFEVMFLALCALTVLSAGSCGLAAGTPTPTPTDTPAATSTPLPTSTPKPVPTPTPTMVPQDVTLAVGNTGGVGVYIRRTPALEDKLKAWPDGTEMLVVGVDKEVGGVLWKNVRDPDGNVGWVPSTYLLP